MGASVVTRPTTEPVSLAEARAHLRVDSTDTDATLASYIIAARQYASNFTRRVFLTQTWDCTFDWDWPMVGTTVRLEFPFAPVASVTQLVYTDENNVQQTLSATQYLLRGTGGENIPYIVPAYNATWPTTLWVPETIRVRFVAGYGTNPGDVPEAIRTAILLHVELLYDRNPQSKTMLEDSRDSLLDPYRIQRL